MSRASPPSSFDVLDSSVPEAGDALRRIRRVTDRDGALEVGFKALLMAAAGATQRDTAFAARELVRSRKLGVAAARVWAVAALVLSSRGVGAYERFVDAAVVHFAPAFVGAGEACCAAPSDFPAAPDVPATPEVALAPASAEEVTHAETYLSARTGSLPDYARLLRDLAPEAFVGYAGLVEASWNPPELSPGEVQLVLVSINVAAIRADFAAHHSRLARGAGATDEQVVEAAICAIPCGGVTAWYGVAGGLL